MFHLFSIFPLNLCFMASSQQNNKKKYLAFPLFLFLLLLCFEICPGKLQTAARWHYYCFYWLCLPFLLLCKDYSTSVSTDLRLEHFSRQLFMMFPKLLSESLLSKKNLPISRNILSSLFPKMNILLLAVFSVTVIRTVNEWFLIRIF